MYNLALFYMKGTGVVQNTADAVLWCRNAVRSRHVSVMHNLDVGYSVVSIFLRRAILREITLLLSEASCLFQALDEVRIRFFGNHGLPQAQCEIGA